jgi:Na+-transporting NADH:ubiquinone oxidoreductase subunit C
MPNESLPKTLAVVGFACFVCSLLVSTSAVLLRPYQQQNRAVERARLIHEILGDVPGLEELVEGLGSVRIETRLVELESGAFVEDGDPDAFDARAAAEDPERSRGVPPERDLAGLRRVARVAAVHLVVEGERVKLVVLPVHGEGFVSTLNGYLALDGDLNSIRSLVFFEHAETPGLGAQIDDPRWLAKWRGKRARDAEGRIRIRVAPGAVAPDAPDAAHEVDGITGATYTGAGVTNLLQFWLGEDGFGPFLRRLETHGVGE